VNLLDAFAGLGGFSRGFEMSGGDFKTAAFCEINKDCQAILKKHWPGVPIWEDVRGITAESVRASGVGSIDIITAGFPCQPYSVSGKRLGEDDERYLWPELARVIGELRPSYAILENVPGILDISRGAVFGGILGDLARIGYDAEWQSIPASAFGAPHKRKRVFIVAYPNSERCGYPLERYGAFRFFDKLPPSAIWEGTFERPIYGMDDGLPNGLYVERNRQLGNSVVPAVIAYIASRIVDITEGLDKQV
jgi:DNA (cytosine-5)-methyltransferase 1